MDIIRRTVSAHGYNVVSLLPSAFNILMDCQLSNYTLRRKQASAVVE